MYSKEGKGKGIKISVCWAENKVEGRDQKALGTRWKGGGDDTRLNSKDKRGTSLEDKNGILIH